MSSDQTNPSPPPIKTWTKRLTPVERQAERDYRIAVHAARGSSAWVHDVVADLTRGLARDPRNRDHCLPDRWWSPLLPRSIPRCATCTLPHTKQKCSGCEALEARFGWQFDSLEFLCVAGYLDNPEKYIWDWKKVMANWPTEADERWLSTTGTGLSAYLEEYRDRLLPDDSTVVTTVPSRAPVIATALRTAADRGWYAIEPTITGTKAGTWFQHESSKPERLSRTSDWRIQVDLVRDRDVLLLDDVWVTGASASTYATALRQAGALNIRCLIAVRHLGKRNIDYGDALGILRRDTEWKWSVVTTRDCQPTR